MEKSIEKNLSAASSGQNNRLARFWDVLKKFHGLFELGNICILVSIILLGIPWLCCDYEPERMKTGMTIIACISLIILCFSAVPCAFLFDNSPCVTDDDADKETSKQEKNFHRVVSWFCGIVTISSFTTLICNSFIFLYTHSNLKEAYMYVVSVWLILCLYGCFKLIKYIATE